MIGCLEAGIDWLLVLRQVVRHLLERYTASRVDVDSDKARLTELYTAHDAVDTESRRGSSTKIKFSGCADRSGIHFGVRPGDVFAPSHQVEGHFFDPDLHF